jgi:uncharacterized alpha/beta hydrolase family protein
MPMKKIIKIPVCLMLLLISGCSFLNLRRDLQEQDKLVTISGTITATPETTAPIKIVLLQGTGEDLEILLYRTLKHPGDYFFITQPDTYQLFVFEDLDKNNKYSSNERVQHSDLLDVTTPGSKKEVDIEIGPQPDRKLLQSIADIKSKGPLKQSKTLLETGTVISLDDEIFSRKNAAKGLWQPYGFTQTTPSGLFFLEKYDPHKKIILFVHGVSGTPSQFKTLINGLDHKQFQPLVAYYPSGFNIPLISQYLNRLIEELQTTLEFDTISVVAHSMGGLVSRDFINIQTSRTEPLVDCFISISTPWNGHSAAISGLKYAPVIIPVWQDIAPTSDFLKNLFTTPLPKTIPHYLLFSFKGTRQMAEGNNDGAVSIASQLRPVAQEGAYLIRGFNEGHVSILENQDVAHLVNRILTNNL